MSSLRRPIAVAAAVVTAAALGTTAFVLPATAVGSAPAAGPAAEKAAPIPILGGTLTWGVLERYRTYVLGMAKGEITVADGAVKNADNTFTFGSATGQYDKDGGHIITAAFKGSVTFKSTLHGFEVTVSNLRFDTGTGVLTGDVKKNGVASAGVPLAAVGFTGPVMDKLTTKLTKEFADQLGSADYAGIAGDPLSSKLELPKPSPSPSSSPSSSPSTSASASTSASPSTSASASASTSASSSASSSPSPSADGPQQILGGKLTWGLKESFRSYVLKGKGTVTPADGAVKNGDTFDFTAGKGTLDTKTRKLDASFAGNLRFQFADHHIDMTFANPRITAEGETGVLILDVKTPTLDKKAVPFATLSLPKADYKTANGVLALNGVRAALTQEGSAAFLNGSASMYPKGERFDDINLAVTVDKDATLPGGTGGTTGGSATTGGSGTTGGTGGTAGGGGSVGGSAGGNLASTGAEVPAGALLAASGAVIAAGAGAVFVARRRRTLRG
ncbi:HtaA domain-containing protein [Streptomyces sp. NPDC098789]|uniref:HtaA domain-containing protein n=1 Tax=Streptomyces sp. NPDC098789 TaxID=3366098 RepID=UPI0038005F62